MTTLALSAVTLAKPPPNSARAPEASKAMPELPLTSPKVPWLTPTEAPPADKVAVTFFPAITKSLPNTDTPTKADSDTSPTEPDTVPVTIRYSPVEPLALKVLPPTVSAWALRSSKVSLDKPPAMLP